MQKNNKMRSSWFVVCPQWLGPVYMNKERTLNVLHCKNLSLIVLHCKKVSRKACLKLKKHWRVFAKHALNLPFRSLNCLIWVSHSWLNFIFHKWNPDGLKVIKICNVFFFLSRLSFSLHAWVWVSFTAFSSISEYSSSSTLYKKDIWLDLCYKILHSERTSKGFVLADWIGHICQKKKRIKQDWFNC